MMFNIKAGEYVGINVSREEVLARSQQEDVVIKREGSSALIKPIKQTGTLYYVGLRWVMVDMYTEEIIAAAQDLINLLRIVEAQSAESTKT